jgi:hypothetical protein
MDITTYSARLFDINQRRQNRMVEATAEYIDEMRAIVKEAEVDTQMATQEMLGEDAAPLSSEESPKELAKGLFG